MTASLISFFYKNEEEEEEKTLLYLKNIKSLTGQGWPKTDLSVTIYHDAFIIFLSPNQHHLHYLSALIGSGAYNSHINITM